MNKAIHLLIVSAALALIANVVEATETRQPNILFLAVDDLRPELACYGSPQAVTPNMDALSKQSVQFSRSYVTYPLCLPSRASMLTGRRIDYSARRKRVGFTDLIGIQSTWPRTFREAGYWTATIGKLYHGNVPENDKSAWDEPGLFWHDKTHDWSPELMTKVVDQGGDQKALESFIQKGKGSGALIWQSIDGGDDALNDGKTATKAIDFLKNRPKDKPFLICAGFSRPHMPWLAPKKYFDLYPEDAGELAYIPDGEKREILPEDKGSGVGNNATWNEGVSDEAARKLVRGYLASVSYADAQVGRILVALREMKLDDNTIVILWGDHGYHLTDHGLWRKNTIYHIASRNPFMMRVPGRSAGVCEGVVEAIDIYPTLLELAGVSANSDIKIDGRSLAPLLSDPKAPWEHSAFIQGKGYQGIVTQQYRYCISSASQPEKLFDLKADPHEWKNLVADPEYKDVVETLRIQVQEGFSGDNVFDAQVKR
nr:sulfatase [Rhodopirellula sp. SM50]